MENKTYKEKATQLKNILSKELEETVDIVIPFHIYYKKMMHEVKILLEENYDLTKSELDLLVSLVTVKDNSGTLAPTKLYDHLLFSSGGMTKLLKKLEVKNYITRVENPEDKRSKLVKITLNGKNITEKAINDVLKLESQYISKLSNNEKTVLQTAFKKLLIEEEIQMNNERGFDEYYI